MQASPSLILRSALRRKKREAKAEGRPGEGMRKNGLTLNLSRLAYTLPLSLRPRAWLPFVLLRLTMLSRCRRRWFRISCAPVLRHPRKRASPLLTARPRRRFGRDSKFVQLATASTSPRVNIWGKLQDCVTAILATLPLSLSLSLFLLLRYGQRKREKVK